MSLLPFVKWAGGKRQILSDLVELMPKKYNTYFEPFVGGGALFFEIEPEKSVINDFNSELISVYKCLSNKNDFEKMISLCLKHEKNHSEDYYYEIRNLDRKPQIYSKKPIYFKAARCLYLNKACFNGLYRVSKKGWFNVPSGKRTTINCVDVDNMNKIYNFFERTNPTILNCDFSKAVETAIKGDFVYFDPPYDVVNEQSFISYTKNSFGKTEQVKLRDLVVKLTNEGVFVMVSNANTPFIQEIYKDFNIHIVKARRSINSNGNCRGKVEEVVITNY